MNRRRLWCNLCYFAAAAINLSAAKVTMDEDIDAVIVEPPSDLVRDRVGRQIESFIADGSPANRAGSQGLPWIGMNQPCTTADNRTGICMTLNDCFPTRKIFRLGPQDTWAMGLRDTCAYHTKEGIQVFATCCSKEEEKNEVSPATGTKDNKNDTAGTNKENKVTRATQCQLSDSQKRTVKATKCRKTPSVNGINNFFTRIVGGATIEPNQFKFVAALLTEDYTGRLKQFCGGSVIDEYHILTAAHCVAGYTESDVRRLQVHLGAHNIVTGPKSVHKVDRIIRHIGFNSRTLDNDIAVLTLSTPAPLGSSTVKQVCLPVQDSSFENVKAIVAGWGSTAFGSSQPETLNMVKVKVWKNSDCDSNYGADAPGGITDRMMCASLPGKDSCQGDSGGALFTCSHVNNKDCVQIGIVSWGISCADPKYPGVYIRVTKMLDWIDRITSCY